MKIKFENIDGGTYHSQIFEENSYQWCYRITWQGQNEKGQVLYNLTLDHYYNPGNPLLERTVLVPVDAPVTKKEAQKLADAHAAERF
jgi:hypothetical protein